MIITTSVYIYLPKNVFVPADEHRFVQKTLSKRFNKQRIEACRLEFTKSVIVQGDMSQISEESLALYFSNKRQSGGDRIRFVHVDQNKNIVITFEDWKGKVTFNHYVLLDCVITVHYITVQYILFHNS